MTTEMAPMLASTTIRPLTPQTCATSSTTRHASRKPRPGPPYAFGMVIPKNPASFSAFTFSQGYCSDRSTSAAPGAMVSRAIARARFCSSCWGWFNVMKARLDAAPGNKIVFAHTLQNQEGERLRFAVGHQMRPCGPDDIDLAG